MALFQPTNIIPSTFAANGNSTIDTSGLIDIEWQINGSSPLSSFQIDVFSNDAASTLVHSTGVVSAGASPVYGTDEKGNIVPYHYTPYETTWLNWGLSNGNDYKMKITQLYGSQTASKTTYSGEYGTIAAGTKAYVSVNGLYYLFNTPVALSSSSTVTVLNNGLILFNYVSGGALVYTKAAVYADYSSVSMATQVTGSSASVTVPNVVTQFSDAVFYARQTPSLTITASNTSYNTISNTFTGNFVQNDGDGIKWAWWRLSRIGSGDVVVIADTGKVSTPVLSFTYDGFVSGASYAVVLVVETENNVQIQDQTIFTVVYNINPDISPYELCYENYDGAVMMNRTNPANFVGTVTIYRKANNILTKLCTTNPTSSAKMKDFGAVSMQNYSYEAVYISSLGSAFNLRQTTDTVCRRLSSYYVYEAVEDENDTNVYHVRKAWRFGNNFNGGTVSNNNAPNFLSNFTKYPLRQGTGVSAKSGTLSALLSNVKGNVYEDTVKQMEELYNLSLSKNHVFLKDTKGNLFEIHTSAPISQTIDTATMPQEVTISLPWQEVADAKNAVLIQLPSDEGWTEND